MEEIKTFPIELTNLMNLLYSKPPWNLWNVNIIWTLMETYKQGNDK